MPGARSPLSRGSGGADGALGFERSGRVLLCGTGGLGVTELPTVKAARQRGCVTAPRVPRAVPGPGTPTRTPQKAAASPGALMRMEGGTHGS